MIFLDRIILIVMIDYPGPDLNLMSGAISIAIATMAFLIYHFTVTSRRFKNRFENKFSDSDASIRKVLYQRLLGAILYGLIPFLTIILVFRRSLNHYGFSGDYLSKSILWWIPVAVVVVYLGYLGARNKKNLEMYPQIRASRWSMGLLTLSALSWITYLVGYEFLFRGFLLFSCLEAFGYWPAIIINICLYSLFHVHKGSRETFGSMLFGFLLCYLTLYLGSFWFAILAHITMALSNEWFSLSFQPDMQLIRNRQKK